MQQNHLANPLSFVPDYFGVAFLSLLGIAVLIGVPLLVGFVFGKKPGAMVALGMLFVGGILLTVVPFYQQAREETLRLRGQDELKRRFEAFRIGGSDAAPNDAVGTAIGQPADPALQTFATLLSEQTVISDRARPDWADKPPGLEQGVYRWPIKSGRYSTEEECRQALAVAAAQAVAQYGKTLLADPNAADVLLRQPAWLVEMQRNHPQLGKGVHNGQETRYEYREVNSGSPPAPFPQVTATGRTNLIEQPLFAETVETSVGPMHEMHALLEFGGNARTQIREAWRQAAIPHRLRWAACGFAGVLATIGVLLASLRFDLASGGKHRARLRWATALTILLVACSAWGLCLL